MADLSHSTRRSVLAGAISAGFLAGSAKGAVTPKALDEQIKEQFAALVDLMQQKYPGRKFARALLPDSSSAMVMLSSEFDALHR